MSGVLVTGATTPLGRALVRSLLDDEGTSAVLAVAAEEAWPFEPDDRLTYLRVDLTRSRGIRQLLFGPARDLGVTAVVHSAHHRRAGDRGSRVHRLNVESTRELLHLAERHPTIRRFVFRSYAAVYLVDAEEPTLIGEDHPLNLSPRATQQDRDRVEADLTVCTRMGMAPLHIVVLRCAELLAPESGSPLWDYLQSRVCLRPLGYDPMLNVISIADTVAASRLALRTESQGVFNVPGLDTLPLSAAVGAWGRVGLALPGPALGPFYRLRAALVGAEFIYSPNRFRFHYSGVLDGERARRELGYEPHHGIDWPVRTLRSAPPI